MMMAQKSNSIYRIYLEEAGSQSPELVELVKEILGCTLKEAGFLIRLTPRVIKDGLPLDIAQKYVNEMRRLGATVSIISSEKKPLTAEECNALAFQYHLAKDYAKHFEYLVKAAQLGHAPSQHELGGYYWGWNNVPKMVDPDKNTAIIWLTRSAEQGYLESQRALGAFYNPLSSFCDKDIMDKDKTIYWLTKAAGQGDKKAKQSLKELGVTV